MSVPIQVGMAMAGRGVRPHCPHDPRFSERISEKSPSAATPCSNLGWLHRTGSGGRGGRGCAAPRSARPASPFVGPVAEGDWSHQARPEDGPRIRSPVRRVDSFRQAALFLVAVALRRAPFLTCRAGTICVFDKNGCMIWARPFRAVKLGPTCPRHGWLG